EEGGVYVERSALEGRDATVSRAVVAEMFIAEGDLRLFAGLKGERRADAVALQVDVLPKAIRVFVNSIHAERNLLVERLIHIGGEPLIAERAALQTDFAKRRELGGLGDTVDDTTRTATAEDHCIRA